MLLAIPSKGRPTLRKSTAVLPSAVLYVPESEADTYRQHQANKVVAVPLSVRGITKTRNWILDNADDNWVVFVDDDVKGQGWVQFLWNKTKRRSLNECEWLTICRQDFELAEQVGARIFGVATYGPAPMSFFPWKPFLWRSYVTASFMGLRNDTGIRFDETFPVKEDYEIGLRCVKEDGLIVADRHVYWQNSHWHDVGGCKDYRTQAMEADCIRRLIKMYPGMVRQVTRGRSDYSIELNF